ncbi:hypothetical protein C3747_28g1584c [Trypanosoma cruzi]|uniref:Uncharacterized protein n=2 Tax=Trypanosoma cruzi TaxID=5693 RepID=Q4CYX8_TRYCC|nr:hypothetical protein, conserved [Trypanosoma cruzi]EAN85474.1 hypothetical protein, conserved [Trypanosoma cruzi]PWV15557.1 hypothetical protein C3747_28g1584c [Trypanosoma cruzi]|eukprot:XP_807325.1 hypothetical protein [Trypanosoma cruzi strain CL Brener]
MKMPTKERDLAGTAAFEVALQHIMVRQDRSYHFTQLLMAACSLFFLLQTCFVFLFTVLLPLLTIKPEGFLACLLEYTSPTAGVLSALCLVLLRAGNKRYAIEPGEQLMRRINKVILEPCLGMRFDCLTGKLMADEIWAADMNVNVQSD